MRAWCFGGWGRLSTAVALSCSAAVAAAQPAAVDAPATEIRIRAIGARSVRGSLDRAGPDSLFVRVRGDLFAVARSSIVKLDVLGPRKDSRTIARRNARQLFTVGLISTAALSGLAARPCFSGIDYSDAWLPCYTMSVVVAAIGLPTTYVVGKIAGSISYTPEDHWTSVSPSTWRLSAAAPAWNVPTATSSVFGLRLAFR
jgi:hypothetical protein